MTLGIVKTLKIGQSAAMHFSNRVSGSETSRELVNEKSLA